jgi:hypothetical protein
MVQALNLVPFGSNQLGGCAGLLKSPSRPGHLDLLEPVGDQNTPPA